MPRGHVVPQLRYSSGHVVPKLSYNSGHVAPQLRYSSGHGLLQRRYSSGHALPQLRYSSDHEVTQLVLVIDSRDSLSKGYGSEVAFVPNNFDPNQYTVVFRSGSLNLMRFIFAKKVTTLIYSKLKIGIFSAEKKILINREFDVYNFIIFFFSFYLFKQEIMGVTLKDPHPPKKN